MWSFQYPAQMLHKMTEPQWFPRAKEATESSLNELEHQEELHRASIRKIAETKAPVPIGTSGHSCTTGSTPGAGADAMLTDDDDTQVQTTLPERPRFWNRPIATARTSHNPSRSTARTASNNILLRTPQRAPREQQRDVSSSFLLDTPASHRTDVSDMSMMSS